MGVQWRKKTREGEMNRRTLGEFELTVVSDGIYHLDGGAFFGVVPKVMWEKKLPADEKNRVACGLNSLVVRTGDKTILIETGAGNKLSEKMVNIYGEPAHLLDNLNAAGVFPDDVDIVINTHLHFDHCGWNTIRRGDSIVATFPKAKYYAQKGEWERAQSPAERDAISYIAANYNPLVESGQMQLLTRDQEIAPGISVQVFPGHTRDMQAVILSSGGQTACYISDLIPTTAHIPITWGMGFDLYPLDVIDSRKRYYEKAVPEKWLTIFTHDANTPWAYIQRSANGKPEARPVES
jgi:glyoxylase-like metal-dependent hydrolase (beta-lactamase superfamily II)